MKVTNSAVDEIWAVKFMEYINKVKQYLSVLLLMTGLCFSMWSHAAENAEDTSTAKIGSHYRVSYKSNIEPLPLNRIHSWVLHVDTLDGKPVEKAKISIYGGMPAHKHGMPTSPAATELGKGDYLVEGLKFSMHGDWEIWFNIRVASITDKVKFDVKF